MSDTKASLRPVGPGESYLNPCQSGWHCQRYKYSHCDADLVLIFSGPVHPSDTSLTGIVHFAIPTMFIVNGHRFQARQSSMIHDGPQSYDYLKMVKRMENRNITISGALNTYFFPISNTPLL